ncbi:MULTISPECIES: YigZ family protein [unclassified Corynebacterium]|uniref:YigZ family protein n=1 Tax=unclassified Corynebacterium TaxID=2624378 RepID=UPI0029CA2F51|nr:MULTISPECIES: YigZ family protein [unclassified Corynebacterium]WPF65402.1 YigZ family protein [Corynebacterium sp. 22KM0430]WPF67897.1 YigZ family protein [Corynebacterium sp. 21KM1197]
MYLRPADQTITHTMEIKRSRFITHIARVTDEASARAFVDSVRAAFPDARHHCSAYLYHVEGANPVERSSDDGEPSGTAGTPMLEQLRGSGMLDIAAVVVRYFGGIKLGAGGLVHAYSNSVGEALPLVTRTRRARKELWRLDLPHAQAGRYEAELRARGITVTDVEYGEQVRLTLATDPGAGEELAHTISAVTSGQASPQEAGSTWVEE